MYLMDINSICEACLVYKSVKTNLIRDITIFTFKRSFCTNSRLAIRCFEAAVDRFDI